MNNVEINEIFKELQQRSEFFSVNMDIEVDSNTNDYIMRMYDRQTDSTITKQMTVHGEFQRGEISEITCTAYDLLESVKTNRKTKTLAHEIIVRIEKIKSKFGSVVPIKIFMGDYQHFLLGNHLQLKAVYDKEKRKQNIYFYTYPVITIQEDAIYVVADPLLLTPNVV